MEELNIKPTDAVGSSKTFLLGGIVSAIVILVAIAGYYYFNRISNVKINNKAKSANVPSVAESESVPETTGHVTETVTPTNPSKMPEVTEHITGTVTPIVTLDVKTSVTPTIDASKGYIEGSLTYPSDFIPYYKVCAINTKDGKSTCTETIIKDSKRYKYGQGYKIAVNEGTYNVEFLTKNNQYGKGYYTYASSCILKGEQNCPVSVKKSVTVKKGQTTFDISPDMDIAKEVKMSYVVDKPNQNMYTYYNESGLEKKASVNYKKDGSEIYKANTDIEFVGMNSKLNVSYAVGVGFEGCITSSLSNPVTLKNNAGKTYYRVLDKDAEDKNQYDTYKYWIKEGNNCYYPVYPQYGSTVITAKINKALGSEDKAEILSEMDEITKTIVVR